MPKPEAEPPEFSLISFSLLQITFELILSSTFDMELLTSAAGATFTLIHIMKVILLSLSFLFSLPRRIPPSNYKPLFPFIIGLLHIIGKRNTK